MEIQQKIQRLNEERKKYIAEEMKKQSDETSTLGSVIIEAIREQAETKNFEINSSY